MLDRKLMIVDDDGKPLNMVNSPVNADSESEVKEEITVDDDYDSYDDMYEGHDIYENQQVIYDDCDIKVQGFTYRAPSQKSSQSLGLVQDPTWRKLGGSVQQAI
ncbi:hypothetical protein Tco_1575167 [Tanacetum coccineum]